MRRRLFLLSLLSSLFPWPRTARSFEEPASSGPDALKIVIVGAGVSGVAAAYELRKAGHTVIMLEGRDRIGGRIWSDRSTGVPVDLGASWIQGLRGNPITDLARKYAIRMRPTDYDSVYLYDWDGKQVSDSEAEEYWEEFEDLTEEVEKIGRSLDRDISVAKGVEQAIGDTRMTAQERRMLSWFLSVHETSAGANLQNLSLMQAHSDESFGGADALFPSGYIEVFRPLFDGVDIRLNTTVRMIDYSGGYVRVDTEQESIFAHKVLVTVPLGVLQAGTLLFRPALPSSKQRAISSLEMGLLNKVVLRYPRVFWRRDREFLGYASKVSGEFPVFLNLDYYVRQPVVVSFTSGSFAEAIEAKPDSEIITRAHDLMKKVTGRNVPEPEQYVISRWKQDPFAGGSYSHIPPGGHPESYDALAAPLEGKVFFAGEATHRKYPATVHGAYLSGIREASAILKS